MMARRVFAIFPRTKMVARFLQDRFEFTPSRGWASVQRACFWLLRKIGAHAVDHDEMQITPMVVDGERLSLGLMQKYLIEVERLMYKPSRLVIGVAEWRELMGDCQLQQAMRFSAPVDLYKGELRLFGLDVTIVPWFSGVVMLPLETER